MSIRRRLFLASATLCALSLAAPVALAQPFPTKPIRLVVGFAPGGGTDIVARALAPKISEILGQPVLVENKSGAAGTLAADMVAKSPADGYILLMGHSNSNAISPFVLPKVPYNPATDFSTITYVGYVPNVLVLHPSVPARNVPELIALAKSKPGQLTYGSSGIGSTQHLAGALFSKISSVKMEHIPYKGSGQAIVDLIAGQINMNFDTLPPVLEHIRGGKLTPLAISTPKRLEILPGVPTFDEVGIKGFDVTNWYSVMGPKGMSPDVVKKIDAAVKAAMADPKIRATLPRPSSSSSRPSSINTPAWSKNSM
ncbi:MAG: tripartite tricarboxylate transporter substrate binding protein [Betaproteobacteria bacterium]|nr:tripartite tricarboxylate transporter substrate binding protein [Betaproteobacteria bacterium]